MSVSDSISTFITNEYPRLGLNKRRQIIRLLFEISRREGVHFTKILPGSQDLNWHFPQIKEFLVNRRYPNLSSPEKKGQVVLPELHIDPGSRAMIKPHTIFRPRHIYIEEKVDHSGLTRRVRKKFPHAKFTTISTLKNYIKNKKSALRDYNSRGQNLFIVQERWNYFLPCPCSAGSVRCGYQILNLGMGCTYECAYCHLQSYMNVPGIVMPANIDDFFARFHNPHQAVRVGTGQFTDSLLFDDFTEFSGPIIDFFRQHPNITFEFKTKSINIARLKRIRPATNIVIAWSLNPPEIIRRYELTTPGLLARLKAAQTCVRHGFRVAFHFDPIIMTDRWERSYRDVIERIYSTVRPREIAWISLGALRMTPRLKKTIENRFPDTHLLDGEFIRGFDNKLRYPPGLRLKIFATLISLIRIHDPKTALYLCMEEPRIVRALKMRPLNYANTAIG